MKVAIVHDYLNQMGGAETCVLQFLELFPGAPIYTSPYEPDRVDPRFHKADVRVSFLQKLPFVRNHFRRYLPLFPLAFESFDLRSYDLVLSCTTAWARGVVTDPETCHVAYVNTPMRFGWRPFDYLVLNNDTAVSSDTLAVLVDFMDRHPGVGAATCAFYTAPDAPRPVPCTNRTFPSATRVLAENLLTFTGLAGLLRRTPLAERIWGYTLDLDREHRVEQITGAFMFVRVETVRAVGPMDEGFFLYIEETDWCYRMRQAGWEIAYTPATRAVHLRSRSTRLLPDRAEIFRESMARFRYASESSAPTVRCFSGVTTFIKNSPGSPGLERGSAGLRPSMRISRTGSGGACARMVSVRVHESGLSAKSTHCSRKRASASRSSFSSASDRVLEPAPAGTWTWLAAVASLSRRASTSIASTSVMMAAAPADTSRQGKTRRTARRRDLALAQETGGHLAPVGTVQLLSHGQLRQRGTAHPPPRQRGGTREREQGGHRGQLARGDLERLGVRAPGTGEQARGRAGDVPPMPHDRHAWIVARSRGNCRSRAQGVSRAPRRCSHCPRDCVSITADGTWPWRKPSYAPDLQHGRPLLAWQALHACFQPSLARGGQPHRR